MKRRFTICLLLVLFSCTLWAQKAKYVVLVSIDGFRPDFYMDSSWAQPNLQQLKNGGLYAQGVRGVFPTVTYPSHTTIITGAMPARHGVYYNILFEPSLATPANWYWQYKLIKTRTLWDAVHKAGLTSAALSWPVTVGAPIDYNIPEVWSPDKNTSRVTAIRNNSNPPDLLNEIEMNATGKLTEDDMNSKYLRIDENTGRMASYIIRTYKPNFLAIHFVCVDHYQHEEGRNGLNVHKALASADRAIGDILEALQIAGIKDSTAIIITGDHGFADATQSLSPNVWLAENGLLGKDSWKAKFHVTGGSAFLHLKNPQDKKTLAQVQKILKELPIQYQSLYRIVSRDEMNKIGAAPDAALAISPVEGIAMSGASSGQALKPFKGGTHGYYPEYKNLQTGFIAYGPVFNKGLVIQEMGLEDITPIIADILQLDFKAKDGVLQEGVVKE